MSKDINYDKIIKSSSYLKEWKNQMYKSLKLIDNDLSDKKIDAILNEMIKDNIQFPDVEMDNNYTGEHSNSNLLSIFDWILERKPIISGNATFYKNQHEAENPVAKMLEKWLAERKALKKQMFKIEDVTSDEYADLDREQGNKKRLVNSYYGCSGMPKSAFYSKWSGPATTGAAQSVISTTETLFEALIVDNYKFIDINEMFFYIQSILNQDYDLPKYIIDVTSEELINRLINMFYDNIYKDEYYDIIKKTVNNLSKDGKNKIFYKNNLKEFTKRHDYIIKLFDKMFKSINNYKYAEDISDIPKELLDKFNGNDKQKVHDYNNFVNKEYFMDPNNPPESIKKYLDELISLYMDCVYLPYMSIDRIHRLKYFKRKTVCVVDTDSNIMSLDSWINFCKKDILNGNYNRSEENNDFILVNIITYLITAAVTNTLDLYGIHSNIPEDYRGRFNMKNEFFFNKLIIGRKKKRYLSSIKLREGNLITPYKADVKGFDFTKATTSEYAKSKFDMIVRKYILETDIPDIRGILNELNKFENEIRNSILNGETTYLPLANAKDLDAYKDPYSQQGIRSAIAWNLLYPDNQIEFPSKVSVLKLNIFTPEVISDLKKSNPREYSIIINDIFNSPEKGIRDKGLQVLGIPSGRKIPDWCKPYIDYNTVINNIITQFKGVLDIFSIDCPSVGKSINGVDRKTKKVSNIIRF